MNQSEIKTQMMNTVINQVKESARVKQELAESGSKSIVKAAKLMIKNLRAGGKIFFCGNGGSAADSQHLATEFVSKLRLERNAIPALALTTNTSILTAISNDSDFNRVFVRQLEAFGRENDLLVGISTSGNSENVVAAIEYARNKEIKTIVMTGGCGGKMAGIADVSIIVPSNDIQRIQEAHITIGHILCDLVEQAFCG